MTTVDVLSRTQRIIIDSTKRVMVNNNNRHVSVVNAGAPGPPGMPGEEGPQGDTGPEGPPGPPGELTDYAKVIEQGEPLSLWHIVHNLGFYPSVTIVDSAGTEVSGQIQHLSVNDFNVSFTLPFGGKVFLS